MIIQEDYLFDRVLSFCGLLENEPAIKKKTKRQIRKPLDREFVEEKLLSG